jgi:hypothetical protein
MLGRDIWRKGFHNKKINLLMHQQFGTFVWPTQDLEEFGKDKIRFLAEHFTRHFSCHE